MKPISFLLVTIALIAVGTSCNKVEYRKTRSGLLYKLISSDSKDSTAKYGNWLKINYVQRRNEDTILRSSYDEMPIYQQVMMDPTASYNPNELFPLLKKGDSVVVVMYVDSLVKKLGMQLPPFLKKGDKLTLNMKVEDVFRNDSLKRVDEMAEYEKAKPKLEKRRQEEMARMQKAQEEQKARDLEEAEKSGEAAKERKEMEDYLASKHIKAEKTGKGTYVVITSQGTGPQAENGKYVSVKYNGKFLTTDSTFDANIYPFQLGKSAVIDGWDEGLLLFKQGGKGTLYIPGYRAYGKNPPQGSPFKPNEPLKFDVEVLTVSDTMPAAPQMQPAR